jgi:hypothetical protein
LFGVLERDVLLALRPLVLALGLFWGRIISFAYITIAVDTLLDAGFEFSQSTFILLRSAFFSPSDPRLFPLSVALIWIRLWSLRLVFQSICEIAQSIMMLEADGLSVVQERQERLRRGESFYSRKGIASEGRR